MGYREDDLEVAKALVAEAGEILEKSATPAPAFWRLVDAAGLIVRHIDVGPVGWEVTTGRGFRLTDEERE